MLISKEYVGHNEIELSQDTLVVSYYIIHKANCYGIEIEEKRQEQIQVDYEYFTEDYGQALEVGKKLHSAFVTTTSLPEILDLLMDA